jgi:DNA-binding transcriptional LysR family regulator
MQLKIDHSTLSRRIAGLEKALEVRLFDRHPTGYVLTPAGESLVSEAEEIEKVAIRISTELHEAGTRMTGSIRVATPEGLGTYFLAHQLSAFSELYPEVSIELIANPGPVSLTKRQADVAITMVRPEAGPLRARKLVDYEYGLYGSNELLEGISVEKLEDISSHRLIGYIDDLLPTPTHDYFRTVFGNNHANLSISNIITQLNATIYGYGICILPSFMADRQPSLLRVLPNIVNFKRSYWVVTHEELRAPARVKAFTTFLESIVRSCRLEFLPTARTNRQTP